VQHSKKKAFFYKNFTVTQHYSKMPGYRKAFPTKKPAKGSKAPYRRRRKPLRKRNHAGVKRQIVSKVQEMAETREHQVNQERIFVLANAANPEYQPIPDGTSYRKNACNVLIPTAFTRFPGTTTAVENNALYAKYLQMKLRITFPSGPNILVPDQSLYVIHGYVRPTKLPKIAFKLEGASTETVYTPAQNNITPAFMPWYVMSQIYDDFNSEADQLGWTTKKARRGYTILGYNKVTVDKDTAITSRTHLGAVTPGIGVQEGGPPQILRRITWPMKRKVQYTLATSPGDNYKYPNDAAIPFVCLYNPQWEKQGVDNRPEQGLGVITAEMGSKLWYNDF